VASYFGTIPQRLHRPERLPLIFESALTGTLHHEYQPFAAVTAAENDLDLARKERDALLPPARERMVQYRAMVEATFGAEHPLTLTLPTLSSSPGSTPDAVTASGERDAVAGEAVLTWNGSTNSNLQQYEIRVASGATYDAATASVAGQVLAGTEEFRTTQELLAP
jgi:hypothetical protein